MNFRSENNPLNGVKVEIPKEPLLTEELMSLKKEVGVEHRLPRKLESMKSRQKREAEHKNF